MRFFVSESLKNASLVSLEPEDAKHAYRVLRFKPGDSIEVCDLEENLCRCTIEESGPGGVTVRIISRQIYSNDPTVEVTVYAGLSKGDRFEWLIQKCVECGARRIVPFLSQNCVIKLDAGEMDKKLVRYRRIAREATKQSGRTKVVEVEPIITFDKAVTQSSRHDANLFLYEAEKNVCLKKALGTFERAKTYSILTGPEGGFSEAEAAKAASFGFVSVSMGPRILRCETAPVAALCAVMLETGNFDVGE